MTRTLLITALAGVGLLAAAPAHAQYIDETHVSYNSYSDTDDGYCREYQKTITVGGKTRRAYGNACRQPDGSWRLENGTMVNDVSNYSWTTREEYTYVEPQRPMRYEDVGYWDGPYWRYKRYYYH